MTTQSHAKESEQLTQQRRAHGERRGLYKEPEGEALDPPGRKQRNPNERGESTKGEVGQYGACTPMPEGRWQPRLTGEEERKEEKKEEEHARAVICSLSLGIAKLLWICASVVIVVCGFVVVVAVVVVNSVVVVVVVAVSRCWFFFG